MKRSSDSSPLKRTLSSWLMLAYGLGSMLGAGIYVLVGKVAGYAAFYAPLCFLLASLVAAFTALSYAQLCSRYPKAAGEAIYIKAAFEKQWLTAITGWLVVCTGIASAAALTRGFVGYFQVFFPLPSSLIIIAFVIFLGLLASWGIGQSVLAIAIITLIEIGGLLLVIVFSFSQLEPLQSLPLWPHGNEWLGVILGTFLAFYAFIGFEDMVNLAEEVHHPHRTLPLTIFIVLVLSTLLYILTAVSALSVLPLEELIETEAPFALLFEKRGFSPWFITLISLIAIINGVLVQIIMAARVMYGMGRERAAPAFLSFVPQATQTPLLATGVAALLILILALFFPVTTLAQITSFIILIVFALVNLALVFVQKRKLLKLFPLIGLILCLLLLTARLFLHL